MDVKTKGFDRFVTIVDLFTVLKPTLMSEQIISTISNVVVITNTKIL